MEVLLWALLVLLLVVVALLALMWLRPRPVPADLDLLERLELVERAQQHIQMALSKNDGALVAMGQQVQGLVHSLSQNQATAADSLRQLVDSHMVRQLGEARQSRVET